MPETERAQSTLPIALPFHLPAAGVPLAFGEAAGSTLLHLEGARQGADVDAVSAEFGAAALPEPGHSTGGALAAILGLGPSIWLAVLPPQAPMPQVLSLAGASGRAFEAALDVSHAWTRIAIAGTMATEFLAKGSALDLHPRVFRPGACAVAGFAGLRTILWRAFDQPRFDLFVGRSHAAGLFDWLDDAAAEYEGASLKAGDSRGARNPVSSTVAAAPLTGRISSP